MYFSNCSHTPCHVSQGFAWVQHGVSGFWPYFFLRMDTWAAPGWYAAILFTSRGDTWQIPPH